MSSVEIYEGKAGLEKIALEWEVLAGNSFTTVSSSPAWYLAWLDTFKTPGVAAIALRQNGRLVGILPLARFRTDARGLYFTEVGPFARADYQPPVVDPEVASSVLPALLDASFRHFGRRGTFWWANIPATDPSLDVLRSYFADRNMPFVEERESAPRLRLNGDTFAEAEKKWSSSHRVDVRRQRKRLAAEHGPVTLWQPQTVEEAEPVLDEFFRVHDEKWLAQGFPGMFQSPEQQGHFRAMLHHLWGKGLFFSTVRSGTTDVSYGFGFFSGGWIQWYRPSYRSEFHNFSPSKIHIALLIEEACRQKWEGVDFLLGEEHYKKLWSNESMEVVSIHAGFSKLSPSYLWFSQGKPYMRQRFGLSLMRAKAWLQKQRKQ